MTIFFVYPYTIYEERIMKLCEIEIKDPNDVKYTTKLLIFSNFIIFRRRFMNFIDLFIG